VGGVEEEALAEESSEISDMADLETGNTPKTAADGEKPLGSQNAFNTPSSRPALGTLSSSRVGFSWGKFSVQRLPTSLFDTPTGPNSAKKKAQADKENALSTTGNMSTTKNATMGTSTTVKAEEVSKTEEFNDEVRRESRELLRCLLLQGKASEARKFAIDESVKWSSSSSDDGIKQFANTVGLTPQMATDLLLKCVEDPDALKEPLETLMILVDKLSADVDATDAANEGRPVLAAVFNLPLMGRLLLTRGADPLKCDDNGRDSALMLCLEYECEWIQQAMQSCGFMEVDKHLKEYCRQLIITGHGTQALTYVDKVHSEFSAEEATQLLKSCKSRFHEMVDPMGTFDVLEQLGAQVD
jgi:hypothetical protein